MSIFASTSERQLNIGLAVLRAVVGIVFVAHGLQKLLVFGIDGLTAGFTQMGIPGAAIAAPLVMIAEITGGLALLAGALTRVAGGGLALVMLGAIGFAHLSAGFFNPNGYEFPLTLLAATLTLSLTGAGQFSVDARLAARRSNNGLETLRQKIRRAA